LAAHIVGALPWADDVNSPARRVQPVRPVRRSADRGIDAVTAGTDDQPALFYEGGASWYWVLTGPLTAGGMLYFEKIEGYGWQLVLPMVFLVLVTGFVMLQVKAARTHTSVELTRQTLRQGTETIRVADIVGVYPAANRALASQKELARWQSARALGELTGVPRGRTGIGLRLTQGRTAQAWARRHRHLRAALTPLVEERVGPPGPPPGAGGDDAEPGE
jgi:hypothetical protein